jgi:hypothetical protein
MNDGFTLKSDFDSSHKKKRGLEYDIDIDLAIFHELDSAEFVNSKDLKTRINVYLGRTITPSIYYAHIKKMLDLYELKKTDIGERGKPSVFYSLTKEAKREWKLNIHRLNPEHMLFRKIYERLFFYEFEHTPFIISSEDELDKVLQSEFDTTVDKLDWYRTANAHNHVIVKELYEKYSNSSSDRKHQEYHEKDIEEYWKNKDGQSTTFEEVIFECALLIDKTAVWIVKTEYWEINKNGKHKKYDTGYSLELPGVAIKEFLNNRFVGTGNFSEGDVKRALSLLIKERLLEQCMIFHDEIRYKIADQRLRHMLENLRDFHNVEFTFLLSKWEGFDEPTEKEKERTKWLLGEQESHRIFRLAEMKRHRNKELMKTSKDLKEYWNRYTAERLTLVIMTAEYYNAYLQGKVVPNFDGKLSITDHSSLYHELELYRESLAIRKKTPMQDILDFHKYLRGRLKGSEQTLESEAERLKMANADILKEYGFLHDAIRMICPLVFQAPDAGLQTAIAYGDLVREYATRELAKKMGAIYTGNAYKRKPKDPSKTIVYDYKRKKKVPHKVHIIDNEITGRKEKIVDVGNL